MGSRPQCTFFLSPSGCKKGGDCTFQHDWNAIPTAERSQRCKGCGAKGHRQSECKAGSRVEEKAKAKSYPKSPGMPKTNIGVPEPPPPPSRDAVLKSMLADAATILQQTVPVPATEIPSSNSAASDKAVSPGSAPSANAGTGATPQANAVTPGTPVSIETLAAQLESIRAMAKGFEAKTCIVDEVISSECAISRVLLDSGATHPVIPYRNDLEGLEQVSVTLAGDGKQQWLRTKGGTLVVPPVPDVDPPQTIVPLGALVESLGCNITWSKRQGLRVVHPRLGLLRTGVAKNTCPYYVQEQQALELIRELEMKRLKEFETQVQTLECELRAMSSPADPTEAVRKFVGSGSRADALRSVLCQPYLEGVPEAVKVRLAEGFPPHSEQTGRHIVKRLPLSRAARRSLLTSKRWVVHLCSGKTDQGDKIRKWGHEHGCEVLQVDLLNKGGRGWDLATPEGVWSVLLWAAAEGRIVTILSSPPHRTWGKPKDSAPREEGRRTSEDPWCLDCRSERTARENLLAIQDMFLWSVASVARGQGIPFLREFPEFPPTNGQKEANLWDTVSWIRFQQWAGVRQRFLETGCEENGVPRHLCVGTNLDIPDSVLPLGVIPQDPDLKWTNRIKDQVIAALEGRVPKPDVEALDRVIAEGIRAVEGCRPAQDIQVCRQSATGPTMLKASCIEGKDDEEERLLNGHVPFRRDCRHCILGSAVHMQHRRVKHPTSYTLSVDLFGPLQIHERGRDEESVSANPHIKYGLVGAFRLPRCVVNVSTPGVSQETTAEAGYDDHLSDYEPSELGPEIHHQEPIHDTLGEVPQELFEELFGDADPSAPNIIAVNSYDPEAPVAEAEAPSVKLPWDEETLPSDDDQLLEYVDELRSPVEQVVLMFYIGLKSKSGTDVTAGIQRLVMHINRDYPVRTLHCDPGTEFTSDRLKTWMAERAVRIQHTLPTDKRSNGLAERTVGLLKAQARTQLSSASLPTQFWPLAMRYACEMHNRRMLGRPPLPVFGQQVLHRVKKASGSLNELMNKWITARYLAPHLTIPDGHVLITEEGNLVASKGFRVNAVDPSAISEIRNPPLIEEEDSASPEPPLGDPVEHLVPPLPDPLEGSPPRVRLRLKSKVRFVESLPAEVSLDELAWSKLMDEDYSEAAFLEIMEMLQKCEAGTRDRRGDLEGRYILGAFCHGGKRGVTSIAKKYPNVVKLMNKFLRSRLPVEARGSESVWSTILIVQTADVPIHRDYRNEWNTKNFIVHVPGRLQLWTGPLQDPKCRSEGTEPDWQSG